MRTTKSEFMYFLLVVCILLQNLLFHIINPSRTMTLLLLGDVFLLYMLAFNWKVGVDFNYLNRYIVALMLFLIVPQTVYAMQLGETIEGYIDVMRGPFYIFLALPVLKLIWKRGGLETVFDMIALLTTITLLLLLINSFFLNNAGIQLLPFDYFKMPEIKRGDWIRIYLISDFLSFTAIYSFCQFFIAKRKRVLSVVQFLICMTSEIYVEQSRMIIIGILVSCFLIYVRTVKSKQRKILFYFIVVMFCVYGVVGELFLNIMELFSVSNNALGISTQIRLHEIQYAIQLIVKHPIMGTGMVRNYLFNVSTIGLQYEYNHTDIGLLGCFSYIGILGTTVLFLIPYYRCLKTLMRFSGEDKDTFDYNFLFGIFIYITVTMITILITDNARIFVWPFILAAFEYARNRYILKKEMQGGGYGESARQGINYNRMY